MGGSFLDRIFKAVLEIDTMSYVPSLHKRCISRGNVAGVIKLIVYNKGKMLRSLEKVKNMDQLDGERKKI